MIAAVFLIVFLKSAISYESYAEPSQESASQDLDSIGIKIGGSPYAIAVNPNNNEVYVVDKFLKEVSIIDGNIDKVIKTRIITNDRSPDFNYNVTDFSSSIAINPNLDQVYVANSGSDIISVIDGSTLNVITNYTVDGSIRALAVDANSTFLYVVTNNRIDQRYI